MKQINFFYNDISGEYIINESGEFDAVGKDVCRFKDDMEALRFVSEKYPGRKVILRCRLPDDDIEKAENYLSSIDSKIKIE